MLIRRAFYRWLFAAVLVLPVWLLVGWAVFGSAAAGARSASSWWCPSRSSRSASSRSSSTPGRPCGPSAHVSGSTSRCSAPGTCSIIGTGFYGPGGAVVRGVRGHPRDRGILGLAVAARLRRRQAHAGLDGRVRATRRPAAGRAGRPRHARRRRRDPIRATTTARSSSCARCATDGSVAARAIRSPRFARQAPRHGRIDDCAAAGLCLRGARTARTFIDSRGRHQTLPSQIRVRPVAGAESEPSCTSSTMSTPRA